MLQETVWSGVFTAQAQMPPTSMTLRHFQSSRRMLGSGAGKWLSTRSGVHLIMPCVIIMNTLRPFLKHLPETGIAIYPIRQQSRSGKYQSVRQPCWMHRPSALSQDITGASKLLRNSYLACVRSDDRTPLTLDSDGPLQTKGKSQGT